MSNSNAAQTRRHRPGGDGPQPGPQLRPARPHGGAVTTAPRQDRRAGRATTATRARSSRRRRWPTSSPRLERPRRVIIMVKAGDPTDAVIDELVPLLEAGDIVIDAGNAHFAGHPTAARPRCKAQGLHFVGTGVSGGEEGALQRPEHHAGRLARVVRSRSARCWRTSPPRSTATPCCTYVGPDGAGHFVKMVHNGIEYADMQLIAEAYDLIRQGAGRRPREIADIFREWNAGRPGVVPDRDHRRGARPDRRRDRPAVRRRHRRPGRAEGHRPLDRADRARPRACRSPASPRRSSPGALSGRCRQREAAAAGAARARPASGVEDRRRASSRTSGRRCTPPRSSPTPRASTRSRAASAEYGWDIDLGAMARIWRGGCIIRARFLNRITEAYERDAGPRHLLLRRRVLHRRRRRRRQAAWRRVVARRRAERHPGARLLAPRWPTTTASAPSGCRPR